MFWSRRTSTLLSCAVKSLVNHKWIMPKRSMVAPPVKKKFKSYHNQTSPRMVIPSESQITADNSNLTDDSMSLTRSPSKITIDEATANIKVEYLDPPIKSDNDKKEYRVIKLPNGLTALLIADLYTANGACDEGKESTQVDSSKYIFFLWRWVLAPGVTF